MKTARTLKTLILGLALTLTAGAALAAPPMAAPLNPAPRDPALAPVFKQFGEKPGLVSLVNDFMDNLMADPVTRPFFADANRDHIKKELVDQFCVILDGPCTYTGLDMQQAHKGLDITEADFNALVVDLQKAMDKHGIPFTAQNQLMAKLAPMHRDVDTK
ncbi:MAG: group 1 truncated hemoglobin [Xanthomonadaceae bacterium]|nr:group 1 truncated hemoglobin [Xanthomonadaceae bacterium]MDE2177676.1 group 1 truncated hemoglobin [Xanthomonadaceae bacterium]MDE2246865.1 group 1 truncated hemoglobin [Xanthomonadaceae bacterium]